MLASQASARVDAETELLYFSITTSCVDGPQLACGLTRATGDQRARSPESLLSQEWEDLFDGYRCQITLNRRDVRSFDPA